MLNSFFKTMLLPCNCRLWFYRQRSPTIGELRVVGNNELRKLFTKGPKYTEINNILWENVNLL